MQQFQQPMTISLQNMGLLSLILLVLTLFLSLRLGRNISTPLLQLRLWLRDPDEFEREMRDDHGEFPLRRRGEFEHEGRQYGKPYGEYLEARKHYTESHTAMDKAEMERRASEHLTSAMSTIRTIYGDADPDLRKKIKADFTKLVADMPA